jgi:Fe2+ or Zn2+ uptake regulation protein
MAADDDVDALARKLSRYLRNNPLACDSAEGIARWWLGGDTPVDDAVVKRALEQLQASGVVEVLTAADGRVRYRRAQPGAPPGDPGVKH